MQAKAQPEMTPREIEIIKLLWQELTADEISFKLGISPRTVEAHRWNIKHKTGAKNTRVSDRLCKRQISGIIT